MNIVNEFSTIPSDNSSSLFSFIGIQSLSNYVLASTVSPTTHTHTLPNHLDYRLTFYLSISLICIVFIVDYHFKSFAGHSVMLLVFE